MNKYSSSSIVCSLLCFYLLVLILDKVNLLGFLFSLIDQLDFIFLSLILVFLFEPLINAIPRLKRGIRCTIVYLSLFLIIAVFLVLVLPVFIQQAKEIGLRIEPVLSMIPVDSVIKTVSSFDLNIGISSAISSAGGVLHHIGDFFLSYIAAYFISMDLSSILKFIQYYFPSLLKLKNFYLTCNDAIFHYFKGLVLDLLFLFCTEAVLLFLFDFPFPIVFALITAFFNLLPYFGAMLAQALVLLFDLSNTGEFRLELFIAGFLLQQIESNFIQPFIYKKVLNLKPIVTLISLLFFGTLFGFVGLILAPILAVVVQLAYRSYRYSKHKKTVGTWENVWYNFEEIGEEDK